MTSPASRRLPASSRSARAVSAAASADWPRGRRDQHTSVGVGDAGRQIVVDHQAVGRSPSRGRCPRRRRSPSSAPSNSDCSTVTAERKVVERVRMIERAEREVGGRELPLRQQRAEDEHRLIAALPRLGDVHLRPVAGPSLRDALRRLALRGGAAAGVGVAARARAMASVRVSGVWAAAGTASPRAVNSRQVTERRLESLIGFSRKQCRNGSASMQQAGIIAPLTIPELSSEIDGFRRRLSRLTPAPPRSTNCARASIRCSTRSGTSISTTPRPISCRARSSTVMPTLLRDHLLGNPHSTNPTSSLTRSYVERTRRAVLDFFNARPTSAS